MWRSDITYTMCCINVTSTWQANITFIYWWIKWTALQSGPSLLSFFLVQCLLKHLKKKWETLTQDTFGGGNGGGCSFTSWKYLWPIASIADNRLLGSYVKSFCNNQCDKTDFHQWPNWGWIKYNYCITKCRSQYRPMSSDDGVGSTTTFDYINKIQQDAEVCRNLFIAKSLSTCFGCPSHPSSGEHKTVSAASGTGHCIRATAFLQHGLRPRWRKAVALIL